MSEPSTDVSSLLRHLEPRLNPGTYAFCSLPAGASMPAAVVASIREAEGLSLVVSEETAAQLGLTVLFRCAWLTLNVHSDLAAVGLTAAFSQALGEAGISCNVIAGAHHDHVFVPAAMAGAALARLQRLQREGLRHAPPAAVLPLAAQAEFYTDERCHIVECANTPADPAVSIARARVEAGITTRWHRLHGITERYVILEGEGLVEVGELPPRRVGPGDVVVIPPRCRQRIANTGSTDLLFLAICSPRFTTAAYEDIDET